MLEYATDLIASVLTFVFVAWRREAINRLAVEELALEIGGHEVEAAHLHARVGGEVGENTQSGAAHCTTPGLVVVDARYLAAALHA